MDAVLPVFTAVPAMPPHKLRLLPRLKSSKSGPVVSGMLPALDRLAVLESVVYADEFLKPSTASSSIIKNRTAILSFILLSPSR